MSPDPRIRVILATRLVTLAAAPVTLLLVLTQVTPAEQGLYFVFVNLFALSQLFETGVGSLVVQYASHESPYLRWADNGVIHADEPALVRMRWILRRLVRWYCVAAALLVVAGVALGRALFSIDSTHAVRFTTWLWLITVLATAAYLPMVPLLNTIEGTGRLVEVQRMRLTQAIVIALGSWILIPSAGALVAVAMNAILQVSVASWWLWTRYRALVAFAWNAVIVEPTVEAAAATRDVHRVYLTQFRTAAVWLSAHVAAQGLTPLILYYHGASAAGQVGATLAITTVPYTIGMSWLQGRLPDFGALVSRGRHTELDSSARSATTQAALVCMAGVAAVICAVYALGRFMPSLGERILPLVPAAALGAAAVISLLLQAMAAYIRAYRTEPLVRVLVVGYGAMLAAAWVSAARFGTQETVIAYLLVAAGVALPATAFVLRHERKKIAIRGAAGGLGQI